MTPGARARAIREIERLARPVRGQRGPEAGEIADQLHVNRAFVLSVIATMRRRPQNYLAAGNATPPPRDPAVEVYREEQGRFVK